MQQTINIKGFNYLVTDEETIHSHEEMVFEVRNRRETDPNFVIGTFDDLLGSPIKKVWKILEKTPE